MSVTYQIDRTVDATALRLSDAASLSPEDALARLNSALTGLSAADAARRLQSVGPNAVRSHGAQAIPVLVRQLRSPLLLLLVATATAAFFVGDRSDAVVIGVIVVMSVGLGFTNEYRAERAAEGLHSQIRHTCTVRRDGHRVVVDVTGVVPGDVTELVLGQVVPADVRLLEANELECDESVLTGESVPVAKDITPVAPGSALADLSCCALMGTVVHAGSGTGLVVATAGRAEFGRLALSLGERHPQTEFQLGLRRFSLLLVKVAAALTASILIINLVMARPLIDAVLFSLAIAVGVTPQLLPAVVATSLAAGSKRLARRKVLIKRLVCIEDLGDIEVLLTDKTGTLTEGRISYARSLGAGGQPSQAPLLGGLLANDAVLEQARPVSGNALDVALWQAAEARELAGEAAAFERVDAWPFDHERQRITVLVRDRRCGRIELITKGAPEAVLGLCDGVSPQAQAALATEFERGSRVVAVASRTLPEGVQRLSAADEKAMQLQGFLVFLDPPRADAAGALARLARLGIDVKLVTGDNPAVAKRVCSELGLVSRGELTGGQISRLSDAELNDAVRETTVFARVSPEDKARIVRAHRRLRVDAAFLGDGVNDAVALHAADVGISVDSATDVAKDAADVVLLEKNLDVLADGVVEGRRVFANTIKYVLMGTSSNFGNMFSAAGASAFLSFLPMLPSQILLNNLLYDSSQLAIPADRVDEEQLARPSHWDLRMIRRFMMFFGPISSLFDFLTFAVMLNVFSARETLFHSGWFVESLATQTLVIFVIRTRRSPFLRSKPAPVLAITAIGIVLVGAALPFTPWANDLGFTGLPIAFLLALVLMVAAYLALIEFGKRLFYRLPAGPQAPQEKLSGRARRRVSRRAARFSVATTVDGAQSSRDRRTR